MLGLRLLQEEIAKSKDGKTVDELREMIDVAQLKQNELGGDSDGIYETHDEKIKWFGLSDEILGSAMNAVDVLSDLLNFDKIESGTFNLQLSLVPIWKLIEDTAEEFKLSALKKRIDFSHSFVAGRSIEPDKDDIEAGQKSPSSISTLPEDMLDRGVVGDAARVTQVIRCVRRECLFTKLIQSSLLTLLQKSDLERDQIHI